MVSNEAVVDLNEYKYEKFSNEPIDLNDDIVYGRLNKKQFTREYIKAYMKLLTDNIKQTP